MKVMFSTNSKDIIDTIKTLVTAHNIRHEIVESKYQTYITLYNAKSIDYNFTHNIIIIVYNNIGIRLKFDAVNDMFVDKMN